MLKKQEDELIENIACDVLADTTPRWRLELHGATKKETGNTWSQSGFAWV